MKLGWLFMLTFSCSAPLAGAVAAEPPTAAEVVAAKGQEAETALVWLSGAESGLMMANTTLELEGKPVLYCQPTKLALTSGQLRAIIADHLEKWPSFGKYPASLIALSALRETFPCAADGTSPGG